MKTMESRHFLTFVLVTLIAATALLFLWAPAHAQIKIGVLYSTTGAFSGFGKPAQRGAMLAFDQANDTGGIKGQRIEPVVYDAESSADQASTQMKKMVLKDKVVAIIGPEVWRVSTLMNALAIDYKIPIWTDLPMPGLFPANQVSWTFAITGGGDTNLTGTMYYFKSLGAKRIVFFGTADPWGEKLIKDITADAPKFGMTLVGTELAPITSTDVTPQMAVLKEKKPDALIVVGSGPFGNMAMNNAFQVGMDIPTNMLGANIIPAYLEGLGAGAGKNMRVTVHKAVAYYDLDEKDPAKPVITAFAKAYRAKYGEEINWASACAYDGGRMIVDALKAVGPDPQALKTYTDGLKNWPCPGTGRHLTMLPEYHYLQHDLKDFIVAKWDVGEKRFRMVAYVRDVLK